MLKFDDFYHLPQLDPLIDQVAGTPAGLVVVAGIDLRQPVADLEALPSGRTAVFRALVGAMLAADDRPALIVAEDREAIRVPRALQRRVKLLQVSPQRPYGAQIVAAAQRRPGLIVVDRLEAASAPAACAVALQGQRVVAQLDTMARGAEVPRQLGALGVPASQLGALAWVVSVARLATLCPHCARPAAPGAERWARLRQAVQCAGYPPLHPALPEAAPAQAGMQAHGCAHCGQRGRLGDVAIFDVYQAFEDTSVASSQQSAETRRSVSLPTADCRLPAEPGGLPREHYLWRLVEQGQLALDDLLGYEADQLARTYRLMSAGAQALAEANGALQRRLAELEAAHRVLEQRTAVLRSLQDIGQALTRSTSLPDLVQRVCQHAGALCGADRVLLYLLQPEGAAEVLAVYGWEAALLHRCVDLSLADLAGLAEPQPFSGWPPGVSPLPPDVAGFDLRAGLRVALVVDGAPVGLMIVQSTRRARFTPGEVALVQAFAEQAALSIQHARLTEARVQQARLAHELDLARAVQQSMLPQVFPQAPGYAFAAQNRPAREVGGDLYDVFMRDEAHIGIVIADVSGKSMPAALYMALTRSLLLAEARRALGPRAVLLNVNRLLRELGDPQMFVTVFYGVLAIAERRLTYARAGHDYPLLLRDGAATALGGRGIVLGSFDAIDGMLSEEQLALGPGDRLALYTDGLTDVFAPDGQIFGSQRLAQAFQAHAAHAPAAFCAAVFAELAAFQGTAEQHDDMTLLVVDVVGSA